MFVIIYCKNTKKEIPALPQLEALDDVLQLEDLTSPLVPVCTLSKLTERGTTSCQMEFLSCGFSVVVVVTPSCSFSEYNLVVMSFPIKIQYRF